MKTIACCAFSAVLASTLFAQSTKSGNSPSTTGSTQAQSFIPGRQLKFLCVHEHSKGDAGSTILYRARTVNADPKEDESAKVKGKIRVGRLTAIVVRFSHVNTFCYDYEAGVTKQVAFYGGGLPSQLKPFFTGALMSPPVTAGAGDFAVDQEVFQSRYDSYAPLGQLVNSVSQVFSESIVPSKDNSEIRRDVTSGLRKIFNYTDRDVAEEDFAFRQGELKTGIAALTKDLEKLREDVSKTPSSSKDHKAQLLLIATDEEAVSRLNRQLTNYATAITDLDQVQSAPDVIERTVVLDPKFDEYEVTATVALVRSKLNEAAITLSPPPYENTFVVDVTGVAGLDFSTGVVATRPVSHDYFLYLNKKGVKTIGDGGANDPSYVPAIFVDYYSRPAPGQFAIGPTFGVDLSSGQNFFIGLGVVRAGAQRISLVGGLALNKLTVLNGDQVGLPPGNGSSIQTKTRYMAGYFIGLTFNFGG